jgi:2-amino-4-hydroxy-6-hydroxymethyldihydropteridine diphosphokinase
LATHPAEPVLLSLGSNIEPDHHLFEATRLLARQVRIVTASRVYETLPVGESGGPSFLNAALEIRCDLEPETLKYQVLRPLEEKLGRVRSNDRNAPRTLDMDISLYGQRVVHRAASGLEIPDPEILRRAHVAIPLADVAPEARHPVVGLSLEEIARRLDGSGVRLYPGLVLWPQSDKL